MSWIPYMPGVLAWRTRSGADGRLEFTQRFSLIPRLVMLLFLPHLGMAVGMLGVGLAGLFVKPFGLMEGIPWGVIPIFLIFGVIFTPITFAMQFLRTSVRLDRPRGEVIQSTGLKFLPFLPLLPVKKRDRVPLKELHRVLLEAQSGKNLRAYRVSLQLGSNRYVQVADCSGFRQGRALAEELAAFAAVPMKDATGLVASERSADELDRPLILRPDSVPAAATAPSSLVAEVSEEPDRFIAVRHQRPFECRRWGAILLTSVALLVIGLQFGHDAPMRPHVPVRAEYSAGDPPPPSLWPWRFGMLLYWLVESARGIGLAGTALCALVLLGFLCFRSPARRLEASREGLRLTSRKFGLSWTRRLPVSELEELRVDGSDQLGWKLKAISDARILEFGGLPRAELDYLCFRVWQSIRRPT
jgi:hypothetical protein